MRTRQEAVEFGLTFKDTYVETPFRDANWQLVRVKKSKKAFLWIYERDGFINLNIKVNPEWRDFWRETYKSVIPGYHQNKEHWNTIILDGTVPEKEIKRMILSQTARQKEFMRRLRKSQKVMWQLTEELQKWQANLKWQEQ